MPKPNFTSFRNSLRRTRGINVDADNTYDYRGYFNENPTRAMIIATGDPNGHFPDTYKLPTHPTFSTESKYSNKKTTGGTWIKDANSQWVFLHSPFTAKHLDETDDYLGRNVAEGNPVELSYYNGTYRLPTIEVVGRRRLETKGKRSK